MSFSMLSFQHWGRGESAFSYRNRLIRKSYFKVTLPKKSYNAEEECEHLVEGFLYESRSACTDMKCKH